MKIVRSIAILCLQAFIALQAMAMEMPVLPYPQQSNIGKGTVFLSANVKFTGATTEIRNRLLANWRLANISKPGKTPIQIIELQLAKPGLPSQFGKEGYQLILNKKQQIIAANTEVGLFYGLQSLKQLTRAAWSRELTITDWPSFASRGVYDDISRGPITKVSVIKKQIERLAELKFNSLSFYIEHVVQIPSYPDFAPANGKLTLADIRELSAYAAQFHMELVGSFQSFGHFNNILSLPKYQPLGETSTMISPLNPQAKQFLSSVITDLCRAFNSPYFNVNCDETFDLGKGKSKVYVDSVGVAKYYADHIKFLYDVVKKNNKQLMMWGDIALQHEEILDMLPKDIIYLTWEYGDQKSYDAWLKPFVKRGLKFIVCPGIVNSNRMFPDLLTAKGNISGFLKAGKQNGTQGALTTIWDDGGMCSFSADWYGVYQAAERSWNVEPGDTEGFNQRYELNAYGTRNGNYVKALLTLMQLRNIPLTYNLADQVWTQHAAPAARKTLIINNSDVPKVTPLLQTGLAAVKQAQPKFNSADAEYLQFCLEQYLLIMDTRLLLAQMSESQATDQQKIGALIQLYEAMKAKFATLWNAQNQPYWLDVNLKMFDDKITSLKAFGKDKSAKIIVSNSFYFQNWLLAGPLPTTELPSFLYSENAAFNVPPKPGDMAQYQGKSYRWMKYTSAAGGVVDLADYYHTNTNAVAYAYCALTAEKEQAITARLGGKGIKVFLNGKEMAVANAPDDQQEAAFTLNLKKGTNHLELKVPATTPNWAFTFRLDTKEPIINHKHKYTLNPKNSVHEAE